VTRRGRRSAVDWHPSARVRCEDCGAEVDERCTHMGAFVNRPVKKPHRARTIAWAACERQKLLDLVRARALERKYVPVLHADPALPTTTTMEWDYFNEWRPPQIPVDARTHLNRLRYNAMRDEYEVTYNYTEVPMAITGPALDTWRNWTGERMNVTTSAITGGAIYPYTTTATTTTGTPVWGNWNRYGNQLQMHFVQTRITAEQVANGMAQMHVAARQTAEEVAAAVQQAAEAEQRRRERLNQRRLEQQREREISIALQATANKRAKELLESILTQEERAWYDAHVQDSVLVRGGFSGSLFVVQLNYEAYQEGLPGSVHGNVYRTDEHGCVLHRVCVAPRMHTEDRKVIPLHDGHVGQILAIKFDEEEFVRKGNWYAGRPCAQLSPTDVLVGEMARVRGNIRAPIAA
jgi:hypothetical protein